MELFTINFRFMADPFQWLFRGLCVKTYSLDAIGFIVIEFYIILLGPKTSSYLTLLNLCKIVVCFEFG